MSLVSFFRELLALGKIEVPARETEFEGAYAVNHAPTQNGGHTFYVLVPGLNRKTVIPFSTHNYELTTPEHQEEVRVLLREKGLELCLRT